jgi:hypothetical protein
MILTFIKLSQPLPHIAGNLPRDLNLNQRSFSDSGTDSGGSLPFAGTRNQLRPKRVGSALQRLGGVYAAPAAIQEMTVAGFRHPQPHLFPSAIDVPALELRGAQPNKCCRPRYVVRVQVHKAFLGATFRTARLAFKPQLPRHVSLCAVNRQFFVI